MKLSNSNRILLLHASLTLQAYKTSRSVRFAVRWIICAILTPILWPKLCASRAVVSRWARVCRFGFSTWKMDSHVEKRGANQHHTVEHTNQTRSVRCFSSLSIKHWAQPTHIFHHHPNFSQNKKNVSDIRNLTAGILNKSQDLMLTITIEALRTDITLRSLIKVRFVRVCACKARKSCRRWCHQGTVMTLATWLWWRYGPSYKTNKHSCGNISENKNYFLMFTFFTLLLSQ